MLWDFQKRKHALAKLGNVHIDGSEGAVRDRTTHGASESEASVEVEALGRLLGDGLGQRSGRCSHCDGDERLMGLRLSGIVRQGRFVVVERRWSG